MSALTSTAARIDPEPRSISVALDERSPVLEQVEKVITAIRPAIQADEGDIELVGVDEATGVVTVELMGACVTCPASTQTLKAGIERIMKDRVDGVTEVVEINALGMSESPVQL